MCARLHKHVRETMARHEKTEGGAQVEEVCEDIRRVVRGCAKHHDKQANYTRAKSSATPVKCCLFRSVAAAASCVHA